MAAWIGGAVALTVGSCSLLLAFAPPPKPPPKAATSTPTTPSVEPAPTVPAASVAGQNVDIRELLKEYRLNEVRADQRFKDQRVATAGVVREIKKDLLGDAYVLIGTAEGSDQITELPALVCSPHEGQDALLAALAPGDVVGARGTVSGLMMHVQMKDCELRSSRKRPQ